MDPILDAAVQFVQAALLMVLFVVIFSLRARLKSIEAKLDAALNQREVT